MLALLASYIVCRRRKALKIKAAADAKHKWLLPFCSTTGSSNGTGSNGATPTTGSSGDPARRLLGIHKLGYSPGPSSGATTQ